MQSKNTIAFICAMCAAATSFAQEISGVAEFKIGMSMEEFLELPSIKRKDIKDWDNSKYTGHETDLWRTTVDSRLKGGRIYSMDIVEYKFDASMGVPNTHNNDSYKTTLTFHKGLLARIFVFEPSPEFEKILTAKYGPPLKEDKTKQVACQNKYGANSIHFNGSNSSIWGKDRKINATYRYSFWGCGEGASSYTVEDTEIVKIVEEVQKEGRSALEAEDIKIKAGASKL